MIDEAQKGRVKKEQAKLSTELIPPVPAISPIET
jgi:hypothetical protein